MARRGGAPVDHDEITTLRRENLETGPAQNFDHAIAALWVVRLQVFIESEWQIERRRRRGLKRRCDGVGDELVRLVDRLHHCRRSHGPTYLPRGAANGLAQ